MPRTHVLVTNCDSEITIYQGDTLADAIASLIATELPDYPNPTPDLDELTQALSENFTDLFYDAP